VVKPPVVEALFDLAPAEADVQELAPSHHAVLAPNQFPDCSISRCMLFPRHMVEKACSG
jgi:hypothetical protein